MYTGRDSAPGHRLSAKDHNIISSQLTLTVVKWPNWPYVYVLGVSTSVNWSEHLPTPASHTNVGTQSLSNCYLSI